MSAKKKKKGDALYSQWKNDPSMSKGIGEELKRRERRYMTQRRKSTKG